jgi:hypothetical protein
MNLKFLRPIVMLFLSALWCALVWFVQSEVGLEGTASLFALAAYAVGTPGIIAVATIQCLAFMFITLDGPYEFEEPGGIWYLYCFLCWAGCMVLSCVLPIIIVLKSIAH